MQRSRVVTQAKELCHRWWQFVTLVRFMAAVYIPAKVPLHAALVPGGPLFCFNGESWQLPLSPGTRVGLATGGAGAALSQLRSDQPAQLSSAGCCSWRPDPVPRLSPGVDRLCPPEWWRPLPRLAVGRGLLKLSRVIFQLTVLEVTGAGQRASRRHQNDLCMIME